MRRWLSRKGENDPSLQRDPTFSRRNQLGGVAIYRGTQLEAAGDLPSSGGESESDALQTLRGDVRLLMEQDMALAAHVASEVAKSAAIFLASTSAMAGNSVERLRTLFGQVGVGVDDTGQLRVDPNSTPGRFWDLMVPHVWSDGGQVPSEVAAYLKWLYAGSEAARAEAQTLTAWGALAISRSLRSGAIEFEWPAEYLNRPGIGDCSFP